MNYSPPITVTKHTKIDLARVTLTVEEIEALLPICQYGMPDEIPPDMSEALQVMVCLAINPLRWR